MLWYNIYILSLVLPLLSVRLYLLTSYRPPFFFFSWQTNCFRTFKIAKKKKCGRVYFCVYSTTLWMLIQQKLTLQARLLCKNHINTTLEQRYNVITSFRRYTKRSQNMYNGIFIKWIPIGTNKTIHFIEDASLVKKKQTVLSV